MAWFDDLKSTLPAYYPGGAAETIVGYVRGNANAAQWRSMLAAGRKQMIILGSVPPTKKHWDAAGVGQRTNEVTLRISDFAGFIVL